MKILTKFKRFLSITAVITMFGQMLFMGATPAMAAGMWSVDATRLDDTQCISTFQCKTIQAAVTAAVSGDTINVAAGTYTEAVYIVKNLTLQGAGRGTTFIKSPPSFSGTEGKFGIITVTSPDPTIATVTVNISGFTVDGQNVAINNMVGVHFFGANGSFTNSRVTGMRDVVLGSQNRWGVFANHQFDIIVPMTVTVSGNIFDNYQKSAIVATELGTSVTFSNNTVTGAGPTTELAQNGIEVNYGASGTVSNNTVSGHNYTGLVDDYAAGILVVGNTLTPNPAQPATSISGNIVSDNEIGIAVSKDIWYGYDDGLAIISNNSITDNLTGVQNDNLTGVLDATQNWWGNNDGPGWNSQTSGNVTFSPFCLDSACGSFGTGTNPVSNAGSDQTKNALFTQTGTATDSGSGVANITWTMDSGPGVITFGSSNVAVTTVSANTDGTYVLRITVVDTAGNSSFDTMTLIWDTVIPQITVSSLVSGTTLPTVNIANAASYTLNGTYTELGSMSHMYWRVRRVLPTPNVSVGVEDQSLVTAVTGTDVLWSHTWTNFFNTNLSGEGTFSVSSEVYDKAMNYGHIYYEGIYDLVAPVITVIGTNPITVAQGSIYADAGATATDNPDGAITAIPSDPVDTAVVGTYTITYTATDAAGNLSTATRTVHVTDQTAPFIELHEKMDVEATSGLGTVVTYTAPDATDNVDATASATCIPASGSIFPMGITSVDCYKTDTAGNSAIPTLFQIKVEDTTAPIITLNGVTADITVGGVYTELGATATDTVDGLFAAIPSETVNTNVPGYYDITYTFTDLAGNAAAPVTRTVKVVAAPIVMTGSVLTPVVLGTTDTTGGETTTPATEEAPAVQGTTTGEQNITGNTGDQGVQGAADDTGNDTDPLLNFFNYKILGIAIWIWLLILAAIAGGWWYFAFRRRGQSN